MRHLVAESQTALGTLSTDDGTPAIAAPASLLKLAAAGCQ
jgi:hypothetical protein